MKTHRRILAAALALASVLAAAPASLARVEDEATAGAQSQVGVLERGWRTGYSDGYQAGWSDQLKRAPADFRSQQEYQRADRAYIAAYGSLEDYRDGYQQGFEVGYDAGYNRRGFDSSAPAGGVSRRGATPAEAAEGTGTRGGNPPDSADSSNESVSQSRGTPTAQPTSGTSNISSDTVLLVELQSRLSTDVSQVGDRFQARVVEPKDLAGATVGGRLTEVRRPGRARGSAMLQLSFDQIQMASGGDWQSFSAQVIEVLPAGDSNVGKVDPEGGVRGRSSTKDDVAKVGAGAGIGAIIGGIAGGGSGAVIGAIIGGGASTAGVMTQRGKDIRLEPGQQLRIRVTSRSR
ncbi:MAG TPA: hypothetical protein VE713_16245 [Pyrinomonadaceae bacterium]|jgi:hypothetical protein|nr:hypothetical protein [Pyrinomonadaceae bacterium]